MPVVQMEDGAEIFYKDWGHGQPILFSHGWPLNADAWDEQLRFFAAQGFRTVAHDRRGHGRSSQTWNGNDMDTYADDLAAVVEHLGLEDAIIVGHSTGGGEVARYIGRHGTARLAAAVLVGAIPPLMLRTKANPLGTPLEAFDGLRRALLADRSQFYRDLSVPFYGANRPEAKVSQGLRDAFWAWSMQAGVAGAYDCIRVFSETDHTEDLKRFDLPTLFVHGDDDQIVPIAAAARIASTMVPDATLLTYAGGAHGLTATERDRFNGDVLAFVRANAVPSARRKAA